MNPEAVFPPFGLRIEAGPMVLRPITDDVLPLLIDAALAGIHDPAFMPFTTPWTDASPEDLPMAVAQYHWGVRARWSPAAWSLELAVEWEGRIVGVQAFTTENYLVTRTGETGSWLRLADHGRGIGTRMRQAVCRFAFDHLDAARVTSAAFTDNPASLAVSRKTGYRPNGSTWHARRGRPAEMRRMVLRPEDLVRGEPITVEGAGPFRHFIGLEE
ncbi:GCN5-related N-acetyltransferase [Acidipropionibacterium acidipropionici ATCC 4875]|uniref:GCN5-related N-acetyltransferase n=1 Tax=Acidipropionibacterium acidipropionici (strain ATCC 4875 / DSM 20272 / JCM 6432 / NBRC 12425 / NCIMB 8070 / 4) TaxID=1171373 RepID=K7RR57_ACIA4|nr:GNAT family protein [Acidipropionibacterium acidipropionici]AFV88791.1 GCN5-related N-acetyltransferase [Acidipropionibacterium acidipropionici ATCC 4875]